MATNTYTSLYSATATGSQSSITFSSIPTTYTDLVLVIEGNTAAITSVLRFNNDTGNSYARSIIRGNGATANATRQVNQSYLALDGSYSQPLQNAVISIQGYSNTTGYKSCLIRSNNAGTGIDFISGLWNSSSTAINRIDVISAGGTNYSSGTTFNLYGIQNADKFAKATGGMLYEDSTYWYHVFGASGTFTPKQSLTADVLTIAGGGSGAGFQFNSGGQGGGGAGGVVYSASQSLASGTVYVCTVGAGGAAGGPGNANGNVGTNSTVIGGVISLSAAGGGYGGSGVNGGNGGSGGGAAYPVKTGGTATSGQGYNGGSTISGVGGAGGGGAGAVGASVTSSNVGGNGGAGTSAYSTWATATGTGVSGYYAGGGGGGGWDAAGGSGGAGGGGNGVTFSQGINAYSGTANTGGGGGSGAGNGASGSRSGGAGGSGVVIIRYLKA